MSTNAPQVLSLKNRVKNVLERPPFIKALIYGHPGAGKTVFAATAPSPLIVDVEYGTRSLLNHKGLEHIPVLPVESFQDLATLFNEMREGAWANIKTVVIDTITELQKRAMDEFLQSESKKDARRSVYLPFQQDYKVNTEMLRQLVIHFRQLPKHLVITAHHTEAKDETTGVVLTRPAVTPKLSETLHGIMDVVGFMEAEVNKEGEVTRTLQIQASRRVLAKNRLGGLPPVLNNPTFNDFLSQKSIATNSQKENSNV